jgi:GT2 family glycosyltransferase
MHNVDQQPPDIVGQLTDHPAVLVSFEITSSGCDTGPYDATSDLRRGCTVAVCTYRRSRALSRFFDSLQNQLTRPERLVIVDASPDDETERMLKSYPRVQQLAECVLYFRVTGPLKGLTRQRNFALRWVHTDLVVFFDDDVVLSPGCLREMETVFRKSGDGIVGVGALDGHAPARPRLLWRVRRLLHIVSSLRPGTYCRSGISVPWSISSSSETTVEGDWLPGYAMMWKTSAARDTRFYEGFDGYAQGEDLEFSLRMKRKGKLLLACAARLRHLPEPSGRPDNYKLGYMAIHNRYQIQHRGLEDRTWRDGAWFVYAWTLDTLLLLRACARPGQWHSTFQQIAGRFKATYDIVRGQF